MSSEERRTFFLSFTDDDELSKYANVRIDTVDRLQAFLDMSEEGLGKLCKMQGILARDGKEGKGELVAMVSERIARKQAEEAKKVTTRDPTAHGDHSHGDHSHGDHSHDGHSHGAHGECEAPGHASSGGAASASSRMKR